MAITGKKISDLQAWTGDKGMRLHVHKTGKSEAMLISDLIAEAVASIPAKSTTGDIVLRVTGTYDDAYAMDGTAVVPVSENQELAVITGEKATGVSHVTSGHMSIPGVATIRNIIRKDGYYAVDGTDSNGDSVVCVFGNGFYQLFPGPVGAVTSGTPYVFKTENAIYLLRDNAGSVIFSTFLNETVVDTGVEVTIEQLNNSGYFSRMQLVSIGGFDWIYNNYITTLSKLVNPVTGDTTDVVTAGFSSTDVRLRDSAGKDGRAFALDDYDTVREITIVDGITIQASNTIVSNCNAITIFGDELLAFMQGGYSILRINLSNMSEKITNYTGISIPWSGEPLDVSGNVIKIGEASVTISFDGALSFQDISLKQYGISNSIALNDIDGSQLIIVSEDKTKYVEIDFETCINIPVIESPQGLTYYIKK